MDRGDALIAEKSIEADLPVAVMGMLDRGSGGRDVPPSILVDVSSMSRRMMAVVLHFLLVATDQKIAISVNYSVGEYMPPPAEEPSFLDFGPAPHCEGWTTYPERPLSVITGLGYEVDQAVGAMEFLDPSGIWAFIPVGPDIRCYHDLQRSNETLRPLLDRSHRRQYELMQPYQLFAELRGLAAALARRSRVIIVPGGPKLFSALAIIIKFELGEEVAVWRASVNEFTPARDVKPAGGLIKFDYKRPRARVDTALSLGGSKSVA